MILYYYDVVDVFAATGVGFFLSFFHVFIQSCNECAFRRHVYVTNTPIRATRILIMLCARAYVHTQNNANGCVRKYIYIFIVVLWSNGCEKIVRAYQRRAG